MLTVAAQCLHISASDLVTFLPIVPLLLHNFVLVRVPDGLGEAEPF